MKGIHNVLRKKNIIKRNYEKKNNEKKNYIFFFIQVKNHFVIGTKAKVIKKKIEIFFI